MNSTLEKPLEMRRMYSLIESFNCPDPECDTAIPSTHRHTEYGGDRSGEIKGTVREDTILCPTCGKVHRAYFNLSGGSWHPTDASPVEITGANSIKSMRKRAEENERAMVVQRQNQSR